MVTVKITCFLNSSNSCGGCQKFTHTVKDTATLFQVLQDDILMPVYFKTYNVLGY